MSNKWNIWSEGYVATGEYNENPTCHARDVEAETFEEACDKFFNKVSPSVYYLKDNNTYWGCRLYPTRRKAILGFWSWNKDPEEK